MHADIFLRRDFILLRDIHQGFRQFSLVISGCIWARFFLHADIFLRRDFILLLDLNQSFRVDFLVISGCFRRAFGFFLKGSLIGFLDIDPSLLAFFFWLSDDDLYWFIRRVIQDRDTNDRIWQSIVGRTGIIILRLMQKQFGFFGCLIFLNHSLRMFRIFIEPSGSKFSKFRRAQTSLFQFPANFLPNFGRFPQYSFAIKGSSVHFTSSRKYLQLGVNHLYLLITE